MGAGLVVIEEGKKKVVTGVATKFEPGQRSAFGDNMVESMQPIAQVSAVYGINGDMETFDAGTGSVGTADVLEEERAVLAFDHGVTPGDGGIADFDRAVGMTADQVLALLQVEACLTALGRDHQCRHHCLRLVWGLEFQDAPRTRTLTSSSELRA